MYPELPPETHVLTKKEEAWQKLVIEINCATTIKNGKRKKNSEFI